MFIYDTPKHTMHFLTLTVTLLNNPSAPPQFLFISFRSLPTPQFFPDLLEISNILNTGLDRETLAILVNLCESGVHPEALAAVVKELRREAAAVALEEEQEEPEVSETTTA
jgi:mitotic-spindle organizing protein 1